jgi:hypothetical protein
MDPQGYDVPPSAGKTPPAMNIKVLKEQFNQAVTETSGYLQLTRRLDDTRYCRWAGQSDDGRKYSRNTGSQVFPWEGASDIRPYFIDDLIVDDVDLMRTSDRNCHMQVLGSNSSNDSLARAATSVLDYINRMLMAEESDRERDLAAGWRQHYGSAVFGIDWLIEMDSEQVTIGMQDLMQLAQVDPDFGNMLQYLMQNLQRGNTNFSQDDQQAFAMKFKQYFPEADPMSAISQLMQTGQFQYNKPYVRVDRPCITALRTFQDVFFFRSIGDIQRAPWVVRRDVLAKTDIEDRARQEQWDPKFANYILTSAGSSWLWAFERGDMLTRHGTRIYTDEMDFMCEVFYGFFKGEDSNGNRQTQVCIFHPGTSEIGRQLPLPYAHGAYPFVLCRRENRSRSAFESRGVGDIAETAQTEIKTQRDARNDRTSFSVIPPLLVPLGRGKQQYRLGPAAQLGVLRAGDIGWLPPPPLDQTTFDSENGVRKDIYNYFGRNFDGIDPNKVLRKQQRLINSWLDENRAVMMQIFQLCCQFMPIEKWQQISGDPDFQLPIGSRDFIQNNLTLVLEFDARDLNLEYLEQKLQLINSVIVASDAAGVVDRAGLTKYALSALDPAMGARLIQPQQQVTQQEIAAEQAACSQIVSGVEPPLYSGGQNASLRLQVIQSTMQSPDYQHFLQSNPLAQQRMQNRVKNLQFQVQQQQNATIGKIGTTPSAVQSLSGVGPAPPPPSSPGQ